MFKFAIHFLVLAVFFTSTSCQEHIRIPSRYLIPEGYVGWIRIDFLVAGAPALAIEDNHYLFKIPSSGRLETLSDPEYGWSSDDDYYLYSGDTRRALNNDGSRGQMIHNAFTGWIGDNFEHRIATYEYFFIGTKDDYGKYGDAKDENHQPKVGPVFKLK